MRRSMVSKWVDATDHARLGAVSRHQSKITANQFRRIFRDFFGGFASMRIRPVYRPMLSLGQRRHRPLRSKRHDRRPGSRHVLPVAFGILARVVQVLLPRDKTPEADNTPQVSASDAVSAADRDDQRHGSVLQASALGLRSRRPGRDRDRPARNRRRASSTR